MSDNYVNLAAADIMSIAKNVSSSGLDEQAQLCYNSLATRNAGIAQSVEQLIRNQQVVCSSHITSSKNLETPTVSRFLFLSLG